MHYYCVRVSTLFGVSEHGLWFVLELLNPCFGD